MTDEDFMRIAIEESKKGDWPYGAVVVKNGQIFAQAHNTTTRDKDPSAHAEVNAIRAAMQAIPEHSLEGYTLYTSSESCPMCASTEIWANVSRVVFGASIKQLMAAGQLQINIPAANVNKEGFVHYELVGGVLADEALKVVIESSPS